MARFVLHRLLQTIPILLGLSLLVFWVLSLAPGDALTNALLPGVAEADLAQARRLLSLDQSWIRQYAVWLGQLLTGHLGWSFRFRQPVATLLLDRLPVTLLLTVTAQVLALAVGIPLGVAAAARWRRPADRLLTAAALTGVSVPAFFVGLLAIKLFAFDLNLVPSNGMVTAGAHLTGLAAVADVARHLLLPALVLGAAATAGLMRHTRSAVLGVLQEDWVRTARAKGLAERVVAYRHGLRTALYPIITLLGLALPGLVSGAALVEVVFGWPGVGWLLLGALDERDFPVLMATNLLFALLTLLGSLAADLAYAAADPRIRYA